MGVFDKIAALIASNKRDDLEYILEQVRELEQDYLLDIADNVLAGDYPWVAEAVRRMSEVIHGPILPPAKDTPEDMLNALAFAMRDVLVKIEDFLATVPAEPLTPDEPPSANVYVVRSGDTLSSIAKRFGVSVSGLATLNNITNLNLIHPDQVLLIPDQLPSVKSTRLGIWGINGQGSDNMVNKMLSWRPAAITCFDQYRGHNKVHEYKSINPDAMIFLRFQHDKNWRENPSESAKNLANRVVSKWPEIKELDPRVYYMNENNLHYENGDESVGNQHLYTTKGFYSQYARYIGDVARRIKDTAPEMKLGCPPFAYGHGEDGEPNSTGKPKRGWAGYDYLAGFAEGFPNLISTYFDNTIFAHYYWGNQFGYQKHWLHGSPTDPQIHTWHAFRWKRVVNLFLTRYNIDVKIIIDECGGFDAGHPDFINDMIYYASACLGNGNILAVTPFLWYDPTHGDGKRPNGNMANDWWFNMSPEQLNEMVERLRAMP